MKTPLRLNKNLVEAAQRTGEIQKRSIPNQIEYWAELGRAVENVLKLVDVYAVTQGLKKITLETVTPDAVDPEDVFSSIEKKRKNSTLSKNVTKANVYYESSKSKPGMLDMVNRETGERHSGRFINGKFRKS